jgi:hypothetical protein
MSYANLRRLFDDIGQTPTNRSPPEKIQGLVDAYVETEVEFHSRIDEVPGQQQQRPTPEAVSAAP